MSYNSKYTGAEVEALLDSANGKQDAIEDLDEIRSGAAAGATALQLYKTSFSVEDIYIAKYENVDIENAHKEDIVQAIRDGKKIATYGSEIEGFYLADATLEGNELVVTYPALNIIIDTFITDPRIYSDDIIINIYVNEKDLSAVATSGSYNDLTDQPDFVTKETIGELVVANTQALHGGGAVYALPDQATGDEDDILVSKRNLKTINGQSLIGEGDLNISGGSGTSNGSKEVIYWSAYSGETVTNMRPNVIYWILDINNITIESFEEAAPEVESYDLFTAILNLGTGNSEISLTLPDDVLWANGTIPELDNNTTYELSISRISDGYGWNQYFAVLTPFKPVE